MAPFEAKPVAELGWDGDWPALANALSLRGVVQQLAQQSEFVRTEKQGDNHEFRLRVPVETFCSAANVDKLSAALTQHFGRTVKVSTEIGQVEHTASALAQADRAERQRQAEETVQSDPFVQTLIREFGATIVPGSIKPIQSAQTLNHPGEEP
jgi:DNA polymerase-3 subunit gamma/tau